MTLHWVALMILLSTAVAGCVEGSAYETMPSEEWWAAYTDTPGAFLLDVRTVPEYQNGHIGNATLVPYTELRARADELPADKDAPLFVYCQSGRRSAIASETLVDMGYTNVHNLDGGILAWMQSGHPIQK